MSRKYSNIFSRLVEDENDLIGLIAYGLYKQHKIEFIKSYKSQHPEDEPTDEDCEAFAIASCTEIQLNQYRDSAENLLQRLTLEAAREEIDVFEGDMLRQYQEEIRNAVKEVQPKWWHSVLWSLLASFVFSLIVAIGFFLGSTTEKGTVETIKTTIKALYPQGEVTTDTIPSSK